MPGDKSDRGVSRRDFNVAAGAAGLVIALGLKKAQAGEAGDVKVESTGAARDVKVESTGSYPVSAKLPMRDLGKTGFKVSEISLGAMEVHDQAVIEKAIDDGCTYVDTAASYQGGRNEEMVGKVMATRRKEVILATKWNEETVEGYMKSLDRSLKRMQTDHIDTIQFHGAGSAGEVKSPVLKEAFDKAKQQGKVTYFGITTHGNQAEVIKACIEVGYVDSMLIGYNTGLDDLSESVKKAREAGIATVIMKPVQKAGKLKTEGMNMTGFQMAIRWLLDKPFVDTVNVGMTSLAQVDEDLKASQLKMSALEKVQMQRFVVACAASTCARCGACKGCVRGVKPHELIRVHMYAYDYDNVQKAREAFAEIGGAKMLAACADCGACERVCPRKLNIRERFREVARIVS
jgi:uncharacterized protein